jgi:enolase
MTLHIHVITARVIADSRGDETIEVTVRLSDGNEGVASVPRGKSTGACEAVCVPARDAVQNVLSIIAPALQKTILPEGHMLLDKQLLMLAGDRTIGHIDFFL